MNLLYLLSILLEVVVSALGVLLAIRRKKMYGWCIAVTFALYVIYDLAALLQWNVSQDTLYTIFFVATLSILWAVWNIFLES
ncbi:MAG: hypothetical protein A4E49_02226 [Methanosaeta sp. PtaU1.Bin112]|nr:MAG: hypothetical protein A4E49_02226 [Methanosaeta sp. PtaU1.Bin112]